MRDLPAHAGCYNAAVSACAHRGFWECAIEVFLSMQVRRVQHDTASYGAVMSALERATLWQRSLLLLDELRWQLLVPGVVEYTALLHAFRHVAHWTRSLGLLRSMDEAKPNMVSILAALDAAEA